MSIYAARVAGHLYSLMSMYGHKTIQVTSNTGSVYRPKPIIFLCRNLPLNIREMAFSWSKVTLKSDFLNQECPFAECGRCIPDF